jgi:hypothetical protein
MATPMPPDGRPKCKIRKMAPRDGLEENSWPASVLDVPGNTSIWAVTAHLRCRVMAFDVALKRKQSQLLVCSMRKQIINTFILVLSSYGHDILISG